MGIGSRMGAGLSGFDLGNRQRTRRRDVEEDRDWKLDRRQRTVDREVWQDPYDEEMAGIKMSSARRGESREEFEDPYGRKGVVRADRRADQAEADADYARPYTRRGIGRQDVLGEMAVDDAQYEQPFNRRSIVRGDESAERENEFGRFTDNYRRQAAVRENETGELGLDTARDTREVFESDMNSFRRGETGDEYVRNARNAVANFEASGDPVSLEDFYNNMYPDDGTISIKKLPDGTYEGTYGDGTVVQTTKEELIEKSEDFFMSHPTVQESGMAGFGGGGYGGGRGGRGGRGRPGGGLGGSRGGRSTGKQSAYAERIYMEAENNMRQGMSKVEAFAQAHRDAGYSKRVAPEEAAAGFFQDIFETLMPDPATFAYKSQSEQEAIKDAVWKEAQDYTERFMESYHSGYNGGRPGIDQRDEGGGGFDAGPEDSGRPRAQAPQGAIDMLMSDPSMSDAFDAKYGEGSARQYLNGS